MQVGDNATWLEYKGTCTTQVQLKSKKKIIITTVIISSYPNIFSFYNLFENIPVCTQSQTFSNSCLNETASREHSRKHMTAATSPSMNRPRPASISRWYYCVVATAYISPPLMTESRLLSRWNPLGSLDDY